MARHGFVQILRGDRIEERGQRAEWTTPSLGHVLDASYLGWRRRRTGWFSRRRERCLVPPFADDGADALGLFSDGVPELGPADQPEDGVRAIAGPAHVPGASGATLVEDFWLTDGPQLRILELSDFVVQGEDPVVVWCTLAPLVVAQPVRCSLGEQLERLDPHTRRLLPTSLVDPKAEGWVVRIEAEASVELRGVARPFSASLHHLDLVEWARVGYRDARRMPERVLGDEDGTRLVLRVLH